MDLKEIKKWLKENAEDSEVVEYLASLGTNWINSEAGSTFLTSVEGIKLYQPEIDRRVTNAIKTHEENKMPAKIEAAVKEKLKTLNPKLTEEQKEIQELKDRIDKSEAETARAKLEQFALKTLTKKELSNFDGLLDMLIGKDEAETLERIETLEKTHSDLVTKAIKDNLTPRKIKDGDTDDEFKDNPWKKETWNMTKQGQIFKKDPEKAKRMKIAAQK